MWFVEVYTEIRYYKFNRNVDGTEKIEEDQKMYFSSKFFWLPKEFRWEIQETHKDKKIGRSAGGMLIDIRKIMKVKNIGKENRDIINTDVEIKEKD